MLTEIEAFVRRGESFSFETTLSGRGYARRIEEWKRLGYRIELIFLSLPTPELPIKRVAERVAQGGHDVPEETIRRRFWIGRRNFDLLYKPLADSWLLYDNRDDEPVLIKKLYAMPSDHPLRQEEIEAALRRAAAKARQIASETGTSLVVMRDGKIMKIKMSRHEVEANGK